MTIIGPQKKDAVGLVPMPMIDNYDSVILGNASSGYIIYMDSIASRLSLLDPKQGVFSYTTFPTTTTDSGYPYWRYVPYSAVEVTGE